MQTHYPKKTQQMRIALSFFGVSANDAHLTRLCLCALLAVAINSCCDCEKEEKIIYLDKNDLKSCPVCGASGYIHQAINDTEHPHWTVDCTVYDKDCCKHDRVAGKWWPSIEEAKRAWNNNR